MSVEAIFREHRVCGTPKGYDGCYSHVPMTHCRADGMTWPCDVAAIAAEYGACAGCGKPMNGLVRVHHHTENGIDVTQ